jgi:hypothetical protein
VDRCFGGGVAGCARLENHRLAHATASTAGTGRLTAVGHGLWDFSVIPKQAERAEGSLIRSGCHTSYRCADRMVASGFPTPRWVIRVTPGRVRDPSPSTLARDDRKERVSESAEERALLRPVACLTTQWWLPVGERPSSASMKENIVSISERPAMPASFFRRFRVSLTSSFQPRFRMNSFQT